MGCYDHIQYHPKKEMFCTHCDEMTDERLINELKSEPPDEVKTEDHKEEEKTPKPKAKPKATPKCQRYKAHPKPKATSRTSQPGSSNDTEETFILGVGNMTKTKATKRNKDFKPELDPNRKMGPDPTDPRYMGRGPCGKKHLTYVEGKNRWGTWKHCSRCALRVEYIPYSHAPSGNTKKNNPAIVESALQWMKEIGHFNDMDHFEMTAMIKILEQAKHMPGDRFPMAKDKILQAMKGEKRKDRADVPPQEEEGGAFPDAEEDEEEEEWEQTEEPDVTYS